MDLVVLCVSFLINILFNLKLMRLIYIDCLLFVPGSNQVPKMCKLETKWRSSAGIGYAAAVDTNGCRGCLRTAELQLHASGRTEIRCHTTQTSP